MKLIDRGIYNSFSVTFLCNLLQYTYMALCEMCGKSASLVHADVEGVELNVCSICSKYGTIKKTSTQYQQRNTISQSNEKPEWKVVDSFSSIMFQERRKRDMNHKELQHF
jgi:ribosome-binding protein aMBF1 (putative translation factor)